MIRDIFYKIKLKISNPTERAALLKRRGMNIGEGCEIYQNVAFGSEPYLIEVGNKVRITNGVKFITHDGGMWVLRNKGLLSNADSFGRIIIGNNVHIGINSIIMPGVIIGDNVVIGVGSVVTKNVKSNTIVCGVPAKEIKSLESYYEKHSKICDYTKSFSYKEKKQYLLKKYKIQ